jgi:hypothetical protein
MSERQRVRRLERWHRDRHPPGRITDPAGIAYAWRSALAYVLERVTEDAGADAGDLFALWCRGIAGKAEWQKLEEARTVISPPHPIHRDMAPLSDERFLELLPLWVKHGFAGGPWLPELEPFPTATQWRLYEHEIRAAWNRGEHPANFRARTTQEFWQAAVATEQITAGRRQSGCGTG